MRLIKKLNKPLQNNTTKSVINSYNSSVHRRNYCGKLFHNKNSNIRYSALGLQTSKCFNYNRCLLDVTSSFTRLPHEDFQKASVHTWFQKYSSIFMTISESTPVITTQQLLTYVHDTSGLPWWATIATTTFFFRGAVTAPLALYQHYITAKVENLKPELMEISVQLKNEIDHFGLRSNWSKKKAMRVYSVKMRQEWRKLIERENCHPAKGAIVILFQLPGWLFLSMSIRNLVTMRPFHDNAAVTAFNQLENEGLLWISNLTLPDSTLIVPTLITLCSLSIVELHVLNQTKEPTRFQKYTTIFFRCFALLTFPLSALVPSCLSFYWLCSTAVGLGQNIALMSPRIKSLAGIPKTSTALSNPYRHAFDQLQLRLQRLKIGKL